MLRAITQSKLVSASYPILVISLCGCFLFYKYILQVYPSVITNQLMDEFQLTGAGLGNLAATFYYTYMVAQLFGGVMLDKYSTRFITAAAIFSCALGMVLFSHTHSLLIAGFSRGLMGIGVAFATVAYMKLAAVWFAPRQYAFVGGLLATAAMAGAVFGQAPLAHFIEIEGWRQCLYSTGIIGFALAIMFVVIVRDGAPNQNVDNKAFLLSFADIVQLVKSKQNWLLTLYGGLAFSPIAIFGGLWGNPFLQQAYHLSNTQAASMVSLVFIGLGIGSPVLGLISDRLGSRRDLMILSTSISCFALMLILYCNLMPIWLVSFLLFIFGFGLGAFMLVFAIGKEINKPALTATVIAMINTSDALLDGITEPGIGKLLDLLWNGKIVNGIHYFSLQSYHLGLSVLPLYLCLATLSLIWIKESTTHSTS